MLQCSQVTATHLKIGHIFISSTGSRFLHDDVIKWKHLPRYWPFVREIHRSPVKSTQRPVTRSFDVFLDLRLNKRLSKQSWGWWFETLLSHPLWRHPNEISCRHLTLWPGTRITAAETATVRHAPLLLHLLYHYTMCCGLNWSFSNRFGFDTTITVKTWNMAYCLTWKGTGKGYWFSLKGHWTVKYVLHHTRASNNHIYCYSCFIGIDNKFCWG